MVKVRRMNNNRVLKLKIRLISERRLNYLVMPVTLKTVFRNPDTGIRISIPFCITVSMPGNFIVQQLFGCNAQSKKQKHYASGQFLYRLIGIQFFVTMLQITIKPENMQIN